MQRRVEKGEKKKSQRVAVEVGKLFSLSLSLSLSHPLSSHLRHRQSRGSKPARPLLPDTARDIQHEDAILLEAAPGKREGEAERNRALGTSSLLVERRLAQRELVVVDDGEFGRRGGGGRGGGGRGGGGGGGCGIGALVVLGGADDGGRRRAALTAVEVEVERRRRAHPLPTTDRCRRRSHLVAWLHRSDAGGAAAYSSNSQRRHSHCDIKRRMREREEEAGKLLTRGNGGRNQVREKREVKKLGAWPFRETTLSLFPLLFLFSSLPNFYYSYKRRSTAAAA